ncbi:MAG: preprotein translocase subunit SecA [Clostridia bacterium]|nr:preprotein translocase subunit SecA [Clostridia bacterium]
MAGFLKSIFSSSNEREVKKLRSIVSRVEELEPSFQNKTAEELRAYTQILRERRRNGEELDALLPEAFALVREGSVRALNMRHYPVQIMGGIVLHQGRIAEMRTGEGKTLAATMPLFLNALDEKGVHLVTVNDYLAKRDAEWMGKVYRFLGMSVGAIVHDLSPEQRRDIYSRDITYGTNNEFGFDYLRDNMAVRQENLVQRDLHFAIVDEVDSILIDEARTPLIISGRGNESTDLYTQADRFARRLVREQDFTLDEKKKTINLTEEGVARAENAFGVDNWTDIENTELAHHVNQALKANYMMQLDRDYVVQNGEVLIVDEFTGRLMMGRRFNEGLHQAIEAKEGVKIKSESKTLATITFQNYFRMYRKLAGMTGTAKTEEEEFRGIYALDVVQIPTNREMIRKDENDAVYKTEKGKFDAVIEEVVERHKTGQPILVGTVSVEKSEKLSRMLGRRGVQHEVLNAKNHAREAQIVAQAGQFGAVTIATNMAGRGTDILLGGNPDYLARNEMMRQGYEDEMIENATSYAETDDQEILDARKVYQELYTKHKEVTDREHERVIEVGGLHIIGTERHESRRIDNQLRGRAGRQGDPGSSQFFIALEDDLMRLFGGDRITGLLERVGMDEDVRLEYGMLSKQIEMAQKRVESNNYNIRKHVLQYDDVMNKQREVIYRQRRDVLCGSDMRENMITMFDSLVADAVSVYTGGSTHQDDWDLNGLEQYCKRFFAVESLDGIGKTSAKELTKQLQEQAHKAYAKKEEMLQGYGLDPRALERAIILRAVDSRWMDHIDAMDQLRQGIGLRAYGNTDPIQEYNFEGFNMFDEMIDNIREVSISAYMNLQVEKNPQRRSAPETKQTLRPQRERNQLPVSVGKKIGRNDPCPCGSGKKYKNCCGKNV